MRVPLDLAPGLNGDDTIYGAQGRWGDCNNVRFRLGRPQVIGGWESLMSTLLTGVCRAVFPWTDNAAILNIAFGTNSKVQVFQGGALYDITPFGPPTPLGSGPLGTTNTTARVDVTHIAHGYSTGLSLKVAGAVAVGGITPNGTFTITVDSVDAYHFTFSSNATSTATGGGTAIVVTPQTLLPAGAIDGTGTVGFSTGAFGAGPYGQTSATVDYFPRTWDFAAWGQNLLGSPRNGGLYQWTNNTASKMVAVDNAPTQISAMLVAPMSGGYMAFAMGCNREADGVFDPMVVRHSAIVALTSWSTLNSTSREYKLTGGGRIVTGRTIGPYLAIWTDDSLFLGAYTGGLARPWNFTRVGTKCGLIGPKAVVVVGQSAFWISGDRQVWTYSPGGSATIVECPIRTDFALNLAAAQGDKIQASSNARFGEIRFDYPDKRDGFENSRYIAMGLSGEDSGSWYRGIMARTAFVDSGPSPYPVGVAYAGNAYLHELETAHSADGGVLTWSIRTAAQLLDADYRLLVTSIWPDFKDQVGPITVSVTSREHPQGSDTLVSAAPMAPDDMKADLMISGRLFQVEFKGSSSPTNMRLGRPVVEVQQAGKL